MSTNKPKRKFLAKRKSQLPAKRKCPVADHDAALENPGGQSKLPIHEATPEIPSGTFWTMRIEPGAPTVLGKEIWPGTMVMKNHGPGTIVVDPGNVYGSRQHVELLPGWVRVMMTNNKVEVATIDENSALLEFEYMPKIRLK
jgi:hypothetical protein